VIRLLGMCFCGCFLLLRDWFLVKVCLYVIIVFSYSVCCRVLSRSCLLCLVIDSVCFVISIECS